MKQLIISFIIAVLIISFGMYTYQSLMKDSSDFHKLLGGLEAALRQKDWKSADQKLSQVGKTWTHLSRKWPMFIDHLEIDHVNINLSELQSYIQAKNDVEALARVSVLMHLANHIPEREAFTLSNIL